MDLIFNLVAGGLNWIASVTGFSYNEINIIAYYMVLPLIYVGLIDRILGRHVLKVVYVGLWVGVLVVVVGDFGAFADWLFAVSVEFLRLFAVIGLNYTAASVVICVIVPGIVFVGLAIAAFPTLRGKLPGARGRDVGDEETS